MTEPSASWKVQIGAKKNPTDDTVPLSSTDIDGLAHTVLGGVTSQSVSKNNNSTDVSEIGLEGVKRLLGRKDATLDLDLNIDPTDDGSNAANHDGHQGLIDDDSDDITYSVVIDFDKTTTGSFGIAFVAKIANVDISADSGELTGSVSFELANGEVPLAKTIVGDLDALT